MTKRIPLNEPVRRLHDFGIGAEIFLHEQYLCPRVILLKGKQRFRISCTEPINTLILVPHQKQVVPASCQKPYDLMLDAGGILRLVHTDVGIFVLKMPQHFRALFQYPAGIDHLVVIIDKAPGTQLSAVRLINFG